MGIEDGECEIEETPDFMFYTDRNFKNQVEPDLSVMPEELLPYIRKHFNVKDEDDVILISILIVSSMLGMNFNHPVILIQGEKGSGKSECLKKLEMIIDPKDSGICAYTSNKEAIVLRLSKSYFTCFDNVSFISKAISDLLCSAVTGASDTTRRLYTDTEERIVKLHSIIGITSINGVARSSDLVDRSCLIALSRFEKSEIKTEQSVMASFQKDLPFILGAIFNTIAGVLSDRKKVKAKLKKYGATIDKINKKCILIKHKGVGWFEDGDVIEGYSNAKCTSIKKAVKLDKEEDFAFYMKMKSACIIVEGDLYKKFKLSNYVWSKHFTDTKWIIDDEEKMRLYYFNYYVFDMNKDKIEGIDTDELFLHKPLFNNVTIFGKEV